MRWDQSFVTNERFHEHGVSRHERYVSEVHVSDAFDSGNIEVIAESADDLQLSIRPDAGGEHYQWFHFRLTGALGRRVRWRITNADGASYERGWPGYRACASYDRKRWFRVDTTYEDGELLVTHDVEEDAIWYAYFAPYSWERHLGLVGDMQRREGVRLEVVGESLEHRTMDLLTIGVGKTPIWIVARQHPGESMAEWFAEGLLERLVDPDDALAHRLRHDATFFVVPNMNPDGSVRGHLRTNAAGKNLNRVWHAPTLEESPEVYAVLQRMHETGVALCLDVHGDEALPYNFIAGSDGVEGVEDKLALRDEYCAALMRACPDFQRRHCYPVAPKGRANMTMCTNQIARTFGALAMTLEQPFKDNADRPDLVHGWSPARCKRLGRAQLDALESVLAQLA